MSTIVPYLTFRQGVDSLPFYTDGLGFEIVTQQLADDGSLVHIEMTRGDAVVMGGGGDAPTAQSPGIYLVVDEVPDRYARLLELGATEVYGPEQTEWGTWRARLVDPEGHEWTIGTYQPGQSWG